MIGLFGELVSLTYLLVILKFTNQRFLLHYFCRAAKRGDHEKYGWPNSAYCVSKVGASALTRIQHRELLADSREDIVINHVHPGYVNTDMSNHQGPLTIEEGCY